MSRPDNPHVGLFNQWWDAYHQALFQAAVTGCRYRVWFEPNNRWWHANELTSRHREGRRG